MNSNHNQIIIISRLDIRSKLVLFLSSITALLIVDISHWLFFLLNYAGIFTIILISNQPVLQYIKRTLKIYPMIFFITLPLLFTNQTENPYPIFTLGSIKIFYYGLISFISASLKSILIILLTQLIFNSSSLVEWINGFRQIRLPGWLIAILFLLQRFVVLLKIEFVRTVHAFQSRYVQLSFSRKLRAAGNITGTFIFRVLERSEQNYLSLAGRGFSNQLFSVRKSAKGSHWRYPDTFVVIFSLMIILITWLIRE